MADKALWDKHRSCRSRIKAQTQMAGAACCSAPDCSFNGMGQQVPCVSYTQVNTLLESKVGPKEEGERDTERSGICYSTLQFCISIQVSTINDQQWLLKVLGSALIHHVTCQSSANLLRQCWLILPFWLWLGVQKQKQNRHSLCALSLQWPMLMSIINTVVYTIVPIPPLSAHSLLSC